jgi:hypothetical protein
MFSSCANGEYRATPPRIIARLPSSKCSDVRIVSWKLCLFETLRRAQQAHRKCDEPVPLIRHPLNVRNFEILYSQIPELLIATCFVTPQHVEKLDRILFNFGKYDPRAANPRQNR